MKAHMLFQGEEKHNESSFHRQRAVAGRGEAIADSKTAIPGHTVIESEVVAALFARKNT